MSETVRVYGPPGTGKTTYLSRQVERAAEVYGGSVGVLSFTRAAAVEVASRNLTIPKRMIGTLHSVCYHAFHSAKIFEVDGIKAWNQAHPDLALEGGGSAEDAAEPSGEGQRLLQKCQNYRGRRISPDLWPDDVQGFWNDLKAFKYEHGFRDFTDLIEDALDGVPEMPGSPRVIFVDEAQDFSALELALVRKWAGRAEQLVVIGDPHQCIYGFKGASPGAFLEGEARKEIVLSKSYRVPVAVHAVAVEWIARSHDYKEIIYSPRDFPGEARREGGLEFGSPSALLADARQYLDAGKSVMFLAHCSFHLSALRRSLVERGVPFANPFASKRGDWNPMRGGPRKLADFLRPEPSVHGDQARVWNHGELHRWAAILESGGVLRRGAKTRLESLKHLDDTLTLEDIGEYFEPDAARSLIAAFGAGLARALDWLETRLLKSQKKSLEYALALARSGESLLEKPRVLLGTVHSVKGGEADVVYLSPDIAPAAYRQLGDPEEADAVTRMFYVGMTRARESLILAGRASPFAVEW